MRTGLGRVGEWLPAGVAGLFPVLFLPTLTDSYILPRAALTIVGGCLLAGWGLAAGGRGVGGLGRPALAVLAAAILAAALSVSPWLSLVGSYARYESLFVRLGYLGLFVGAAWLARSARSREWALSAYVAGCVVLSLEAVFELLTGFPARPDGNLGQANLLGAVLAMAVPITCSRLIRSPFWAIPLVPLLAGLVLSSSRSGWLGALAGTVLLFPLLARSRRWRSLLLAGAVASVGLGLALIVLTPLAGLNSDTGSARLHVWRDALPLVAARPLSGYGEDTLGLVFGRYLTGNWEPGATFDRAHQNELDLLATQGGLGLAACTWLFGAWFLACWRRAWTEIEVAPAEPCVPAVIAAFTAYLVYLQLNFDWAPATGPLWLLAGVAWAALVPPRREGTLNRLSLVVAPVLLAIAVVFGVLPVLADQRSNAGDVSAATLLDPLQAHYWRQLGESEIGAVDPGSARRARTDLERAVLLGDYDAKTYIELGDVDLRLGDRSAATAAYRKAVELDRFNQLAGARLKSVAG